MTIVIEPRIRMVTIDIPESDQGSSALFTLKMRYASPPLF
jgi:hypothetical protein